MFIINKNKQNQNNYKNLFKNLNIIKIFKIYFLSININKQLKNYKNFYISTIQKFF